MGETMEKTTTAAPPSSPQAGSPRPMHQLLLLSPSPSPSSSSTRALLRKSTRTRLSHDLALVSPPPSPVVDPTTRRRCKTRNAGSPSSRVGRRRRKILDGENKAEMEEEEAEEMRKSRKSRNSKDIKGGLNSVKSPTPRADDGNYHSDLDRIGQMMSDLIMWNDVAKSSLWFGFGCLSFLSSCFAKGINFSIFSFLSQLGLLVLGFSFISHSICQRNNIQNKSEFKLTEEDILKAGRVILPTVNFAISKTRQLFSGEPNMTLKVFPFLLIGAEYGHLMTLRRLWALGFFVSFSCPKLYLCYSMQINTKVMGLKRWAIETWGACSQKKIVATSAATAFWHLTSIRTRIFAGADDGNYHSDLDRIGQMMSDLIMWNDVAKSSLWFGFGCLSFLSSCFAKGINFSIFSFLSQLGLLVLGFSFISHSICQRNNIQNKSEFKLTEEDILKAGRVILPTVNFAISKTRQLFSGEPNMTLKVFPFLLIGAEYGHLMTLRRLWALGFFVSFSCPKLYLCYSMQINTKVMGLKRWAIETWGACSQKKIVATSAATAFWHLTSIRTRIFAAFLLIVILRYKRQNSRTTVQEEEVGEEQLVQSKALVVVETESAKQ